MYSTTYQTREIPIYIVLGCGALSSCVGQLVTYPITLLRIRRQGQVVPLPQFDKIKAHPLLPVEKMVKDIWHNEGLVGFYRGLIPNILKVVPAVSVSYLVYETVIKALSNGNTYNEKS